MTTNRFEAPGERATVRELLLHDHERLDQLFDELLAGFASNPRGQATQLWREFEAGLSAHMDLEERVLIPPFSVSHLLEADGLLGDHARIRAKLAELGAGAAPHPTRADALEELAESLHGHAHREAVLMYRWAEEELGEEPRELVKRWLGQRLCSFSERHSSK